MIEEVVLVDEHDKAIGVAEKIEAHRKALLHRAFSAFILAKNNAGELITLLQCRSPDKYHCPGLWTNSFCSHPRPGESVLAAAERRCYEELGLHLNFEALGAFIYKAVFENGLTEYEYDHVLIAEVELPIQFNPNPNEVCDVRWVKFDEVFADIALQPDAYTPWFPKALQLVANHNVGL